MGCYGRELVAVHGTERTSVRGFFQPVTGKVERLALKQMGALGLESRERFIYIGPAAVALERGDLVEVEERVYHVRSAECIWGDGEPVYCWAMCTQRGCEDAWGSNG